MKSQNNANHTRRDRGFVIAFLILLAWTLIGFYNLFQELSGSSLRVLNQSPGTYIQNILIFLIPFSVIIFAWIGLLKLRKYAEKLQDRIIRQEVNFRHYVATGKQLDPALTISQIIALRFAGDNEFVELCEKAASENLSNKEIKAIITNRKADHNRV